MSTNLELVFEKTLDDWEIEKLLDYIDEHITNEYIAFKNESDFEEYSKEIRND